MSRSITITCSECRGTGGAYRHEVHEYEPCPACEDGTRTLLLSSTMFAWLAGARSPQDLLARLGRAVFSADQRAAAARADSAHEEDIAATVEAASLAAARDALASVLGTAIPGAAIREDRSHDHSPKSVRLFSA